MDNFHFLQPYWFIALLFLLLWLWLGRKNKFSLPTLIQQSKVRYPSLSLITSAEKTKTLSSKSTGVYFFSILFFMLIIMSLSQPVRFREESPSKPEADPVDLILVVNTSVSMILKDYKVDGKQLDRMAMTRLLLQKLVSDFKGKRIGLVVLGRPSSIWLPLTDDLSLVSNIIGRLKTTLGGRNSDIGETLDLIQKQFVSDSNKSHKIVMLVSDGYEQLGVISPPTAVEKLVRAGFKFHTLAVGSTTKPEFSLGKGHLIYQAVDLNLMTRLAKIGKGEMVHAKDLTAIDNVLSNISIPPVVNSTEQDRTIYSPLYQYPLTLSLFILFLVIVPISIQNQFSRVKYK